jgi:hypothetical protein
MGLSSSSTSTGTIVADLTSTGHICISSTVETAITLDVRAGWTADGAEITVTREITVLEPAEGTRPSRKHVVSVAVGGIAGLPKKVDYVLFFVRGSADTTATVEVGRCGSSRKEVLVIEAGSPSGSADFVRLSGGKLCVSASSLADVTIHVVGYGSD